MFVPGVCCSSDCRLESEAGERELTEEREAASGSAGATNTPSSLPNDFLERKNEKKTTKENNPNCLTVQSGAMPAGKHVRRRPAVYGNEDLNVGPLQRLML